MRDIPSYPIFVVEKYYMRYKLNAEQKKAVNSKAQKILCLAGAGTGKTQTMIERIVHLVGSGVSPSSILALTFTNAAAFEMKSRYKEFIDGGESPDFRTFHSYCYDLLSRDRDIQKKLGYSSMPEIADEKMEKRLEKEAIMQSGIQLQKKKLDNPSTMTVAEQTSYKILQKCKKRLMIQKNIITFDELCSGVCNLFTNCDTIIKSYKDKIKYLCVDEYQDTDQIQHDFVMSFGNSANIFVVGDALQSLYVFRGAMPNIIKSLAMDPEWELIRLTKNYRSTKNICEFANLFSAKYADESYRIPIESDRDGRPVDIRSYTGMTTSQKYKDIFKRIATECKCLRGTVAIIARTNMECDSIREELDAHGVQYSTNHKNIDAKYILPSVTDSTFMINWLATFLPSEQYSEFIRIAVIQSNGDSEYTEKEFMGHFGLNPEIAARAESIYAIRNLLRSKKLIDYICKNILQIVGYPNLKVSVKDVEKVSDLLSKILSEIETQPRQNSEVYVGTIHSVKGLEYDTVYIMGVDGYHFKLNTEENKNVYYVAITRAKDNLVIYS